MRIWDIVIVDEFQPDGEVTSREPRRTTFVAQISSAVRNVVVGVAVASSCTFPVAQPFDAASIGSRVQVLRPAGVVLRQTYSRSGPASATDTQYGQSSARLARAFASYFQPAAAEDEVDDEYCFG